MRTAQAKEEGQRCWVDQGVNQARRDWQRRMGFYIQDNVLTMAGKDLGKRTLGLAQTPSVVEKCKDCTPVEQ